mmetsp:Transcript_46343/g.136951  ORF Transcript_46343/g.136951 Transcript_46343/m.136951 type:complete len:401 (-) Transcript_46343:130-1332(-)
MATGHGTRLSDNEALIESSFRRLLASIESERETIRNTWLQIENEHGTTSQELERLRQDTDEWCEVERHKITKMWSKIDKLRDDYSVLWKSEVEEMMLHLNCAGTLFDVPKKYLTVVEGSYLNHMFSNAFIASVPRMKDDRGRERYFLDFNPVCFAYIVEFMKGRFENPKSQPPAIPPEQQQNMDLLAEALHLTVFMRPNGIPQIHDTSLLVRGSSIQATLQGWQVITAQDPMPMSGASYFEVKVLKNPEKNAGGIAIGVCGHVPSGTEIHSIRLKHSVLYNSSVGPIGDMIAVDNVAKGLQFKEGHTIGVRHNIATRTLQWYHNRLSVGSCTLRGELLENMRVMYPVFALYEPEQKIEVDFTAVCPGAMRGGGGGAPGSPMGDKTMGKPGMPALGDGSAS